MRRLFAACLGSGPVILCLMMGYQANAASLLTHSFSTSAGPLDDALKQFADQSGVSVIYDHRIVSGRMAPPIVGPLTTRDALSALLDGTTLEYREIDNSTLAIIERRRAIEAVQELPVTKLDNQTATHRIDEIIVTTSYRAPGVLAGLDIDYTLDAEALNLAGSQSIAEPIHELPATVASVSSANTQLLVSAGGLDLTDLRGLGPARSLTLVNGRRFVRTSGGNGNIYGVDLNAIPTPLVDRVEVINQSAGPSLGTDAVGGVVNIVMRDHINGVSLNAHGGTSERGDASEYSFSIFAGIEFADGRGKISGGGVYAKQPSLLFTDRGYLSEAYGFALNGQRSNDPDAVFLPGFGGSTLTPTGLVAGAIDSNGDVALIANAKDQLRLTLGGFEIFEDRADQLYNWVEGFSALPENERWHGYARADFEPSHNLSIYGEMLFADIDVATQIASTPVSWRRGVNNQYGDSIVVPADHPDAPAGLRAAIEAVVGGSIDSFLINRRFAELGPRRQEIDRRTLDLNIGGTLDLGNEWSLNASYGFGRNRSLESSLNRVDAARIMAAVDPTLCAATPGCVPVNIFAGATVPPSAAEYYRLTPRERQIETTEHVARVTAAGPFYSVGQSEGRLSGGVEYRRDAIQDDGNSGLSEAIGLGELRAPGASGAVGYAEIFAGADLPLSHQETPMGELFLGADARLTRWSGKGFVANISGDLSWTPTDGLEVYAFTLYGGRAPNVVELFSAGPNLSELRFDPCSFTVDDNVADNCASTGALGVPAGFSQQNALVDINFFGNPNLDHEDVHTRHFGVAMDVQEFIFLNEAALRLTADWRFHRITNGIDGVSEITVLTSCYFSTGLSSRFCGNNPATGRLFIQRDAATGNLAQIERTFLNGADERTSGLDASLAYRDEFYWMPLGPAFSLDILYSYTHSIEYRGILEDELTELVGLANFPRHQVYATTALETERWKTLWTVRRRGAAQTVGGDFPAAALPARTYVDAGLQFRPSDNLILYAGVENLFDRELPVAAFAERGFFAEFYDVIGRRYFAGVKAEF